MLVRLDNEWGEDLHLEREDDKGRPSDDVQLDRQGVGGDTF